MNSLPPVLLATAVAVVLLQLATWTVSRRLGRVSVVDVTWGLGFALIAVVGFAASLGSGDGVRRGLLVGLTVVWGTRLGLHIASRQRGRSEEDPRYVELLGPDPAAAAALTKVFLLQAALGWFISLPVQVGLVDDGPLGVLGWLGVALWLVGFSFEAVGDRQLATFRADPDSKGRVLDTGLWRYTRHPNYFGDACVWWGLFLLAADAGWGWLTVASPALMTWFLVAKTGKPLMERQLARSRPGYAEYVERTSGFLPLPPGSRPARRT